VVTDCPFVIRTAVRYLPLWKQNGWHNVKGETVKNIDDILEFSDGLKRMKQVVWRAARPEWGALGNEEAIKLALLAIKKERNITQSVRELKRDIGLV